MEKWIFVNNITSLEKLYVLTKEVNEKEITKDNHAIKLMEALNRNGANRNEANNHPLNYILFYNMISYLDGKYILTKYGKYLIENYDILLTNKQKRSEFFFEVLYNIKFPNDAVETSKKYKVYPFRIIFKLLLEKRINNKITIEEFEKILSYVYVDADYDVAVKTIIDDRVHPINFDEKDKIAQAATVIAGWVNQFNVMKKEDKYIMISDELNKLIPKLSDDISCFDIPFNEKFIKFVVKKYLVSGLSHVAIENEFYNSTERRGFLARDVLVYYGINNEENKAIYSGKNLNVVCSFLKLNSDVRIRNIGRLLLEENEEFVCENNDLEIYTKEDFLKDVYLDSKEYDKLNNLLDKKMNIILEGAPGVGKTFMAKRLAYSRIGYKDESKIKVVQFHQSYGYEDFIEGIKPLKEGGFDVKSGVFKDFCEQAKGDPSNKYYFIIDEINRGNISKILGELMMLIEADKRDTEKIVLPYSNEEFYVPSNIYIIGMLNTADRSLALIDYALRRRFSFYKRIPAFENETFKNYIQEQASEKADKLIEAIKKLNLEIKEDESLGEGFEIGHSYFCNLKQYEDEINDILEFDIKPMLKEYWFDESEKYKKWEKILNGVVNE